MTVKAAVETVTDQGIFEAVISTSAVDRERDVVVPSAMVDALHAWTSTGKKIPLAWNHSSNPEDIVGFVDPASALETSGEVMVAGRVDLNTERGREVWRLAKSGTLGFSFGYLTTDEYKRPDGTREIRGLDVFEITATSTPMNADTRVVSTKAIDDEYDCVRSEISRRMFDLLTGPIDGKSFDATEEESLVTKRHAPITVKSYPID